MADRRNFRMTLLGATALVAACAGATGAMAQDARDAQAATSVDDIVVTAQLRAQDPIEVPFALTAYSGSFLADLGVQDFEQLSAFVPGFLVQNQSPNNPGFVMRGITSDSGDSTVEPRVSVFQDGVSISKSRGSFVELFDIERVEVAKGPQSTLYGRGALIGAVNIIQNRADIDGLDAAARAGFGSEDYRMVELMLNAPIGDGAAIRFATRMKTRDGYVDNLTGGPDHDSVDTRAYRLSGAFEPNDALRIDIIGNYQADASAGTSFKSRAYLPQDATTGAVLGTSEPWTGAALTPGGNFDGGKSLGLDREVYGVTGLVRYDLSDSLTLNATTAWRRFDSYETFDADGISLPLLTAAEDAEGEQWSQELRLNYDSGGRVSAFVGAGYFREEGAQRVPVEFDERVALAQFAGYLDGSPASLNTTLPLAAYGSPALLYPLLAGFGVPAPFIPGIAANLKPSHIETATNASELESFDLFGDVTFRVTDRLELAAGVRYTHDDKTSGYAASIDNGRSVLGSLLALGAIPPAGQLAYLTALATPGAANAPVTAAFPLFGLTFQPTAGNGSTVTRDLEDDGFTWRATARYALSDDASVYANYARGRRPKVLAASAPAAPFAAPRFTEVDAEQVDSYEVGAKAALLDRRLRLDGAVYAYTYENFQTTVQQGTVFVTTNAGKAESYGFEGQANWSVNDWFELFGTYGYNHSRFKAGIYEGNHFRLSPDNRASVGLVWTIPVGGGAFEIQPTYTWQSEVFFDDNNDRTDLQTRNFVADAAVDEVQEAYGLLNLRVRYAPGSQNWAVEAFADNLTDETYFKDAGNTGDGLGLPTFIAGAPRMYGLNLSLRY
ncbi:TonB-dependent receptor [Brevundimonas sp.]|uniref:TonB-dependent receptor n=1 Tax=Brevundimonas sp. TaxID=1871086 RepID=UPI00248783F5|nr:TonB-dependent receptor [Brevundimonas sp.]MDI1282499.1 TonB-dependent receptor [Brevundimonas sp.]